jgi:hypothetical protein
MPAKPKPPLESEVQREILLASPSRDCRLLRNNVGAFEDKTGRWVHYGVGGNGGSDTLGPTTITITTEMVGHQVAVFTAIECKRVGKRATEEQDAFLAMVRSRGGIGAVCHSVEEFQGAIDAYCAALRGASPPSVNVPASTDARS